MKLRTSISYSIVFVVFLWIITGIDFLIPIDFTKLGVYPRTLFGLLGIPIAVFLHSGFTHVASNSIPLIVLMSIMILFYNKIAFIAMFFMIIFTNSLVWVLGRPAYHVGASGLVYSLVAFLIAAGFYKRAPLSIFISAIIGLLYGGLIWGAIPGLVSWYVSWETHLFGAIMGVYLAYFYRKYL